MDNAFMLKFVIRKEERRMTLHTMSYLFAFYLTLFAVGAGIEIGIMALTADYYLSLGKKYAINMRNLLILALLIIVATGVMVVNFFAKGVMSASVIHIMLAIIGAIEGLVLVRFLLPFLIIKKPLE